MAHIALPVISIGQTFAVIGMFLQYSLLLLIYYFLYRMIHFGYGDLLKQPQAAPTTGSIQDGTARLVVMNKGSEQQLETEYAIHEGMTFGRNKHNTIILEDPFVSYEHACISSVGQDYVLTDLHSRNGVFVNETKIQAEWMLSPGDEIRIGAVIFRFER